MTYLKLKTPYGRGECLEDSAVCLFLKQTDPTTWFAAIPKSEKHGYWRNTSVQVLGSEGSASETVFCKHYPIKRRLQRLFAHLGLYRSASVFKLNRRLCDSGFPTPRPLGHFISNNGPRAGTFLFLENLEGYTDLRYCTESTPVLEYFLQHQLIERSLDLMARLHREGIVHRDFKFGNLLWNPEANRLCLIDFDGARTFDPAGSIKPRARDITRFTLACHQAGLDEWTLDKMVSLYQQKAGLNRQDLHHACEDLYAVLLARHQRKR